MLWVSGISGAKPGCTTICVVAQLELIAEASSAWSCSGDTVHMSWTKDSFVDPEGKAT